MSYLSYGGKGGSLPLAVFWNTKGGVGGVSLTFPALQDGRA